MFLDRKDYSNTNYKFLRTLITFFQKKIMSYSSFTKEQVEKLIEFIRNYEASSEEDKKKIIQDLAEQVKAALKKSQN